MEPAIAIDTQAAAILSEQVVAIPLMAGEFITDSAAGPLPE
jgi:hypothetical protein